MGETSQLRWRTEDSAPQTSLFPDLYKREVGKGEFRGLEFLHVQAKSLINRIPPNSNLPFTHTINTYRGCSHACTYCFARTSHEYLNLNRGEDFDRRIVVKVNAPEVLRRELNLKSWNGDHIALGTNTDPYQRCEGKYHLTQEVIRTLGEARNPYSILTKSTLILRDIEDLQVAASNDLVQCNFSIGSIDAATWRQTEPGTPHPLRRLDAVAKLNAAGIPTGVLIAPILPGLSDKREQIEAVTQAAIDSGAVSVSPIFLHLRPGVKDHYYDWLSSTRPDLLELHKSLYGRRSYLEFKNNEIARIVASVIRRNRQLTRLPPPSDRRNIGSKQDRCVRTKSTASQVSLPGII